MRVFKIILIGLMFGYIGYRTSSFIKMYVDNQNHSMYIEKIQCIEPLMEYRSRISNDGIVISLVCTDPAEIESIVLDTFFIEHDGTKVVSSTDWSKKNEKESE